MMNAPLRGTTELYKNYTRSTVIPQIHAYAILNNTENHTLRVPLSSALRSNNT